MIYHHYSHINFKDISEIFYYLASGIGLLLGGFGGWKVWREMAEKQKIKRKFEYFKKTYPPTEIGKTFYLYKENDGDRLFVYDKEERVKHWVRNPHTRRELEFPGRYIAVPEDKKRDLEKYKWGEKIIAP